MSGLFEVMKINIIVSHRQEFSLTMDIYAFDLEFWLMPHVTIIYYKKGCWNIYDSIRFENLDYLNIP